MTIGRTDPIPTVLIVGGTAPEPRDTDVSMVLTGGVPEPRGDAGVSSRHAYTWLLAHPAYLILAGAILLSAPLISIFRNRVDQG
jgi:hypothetical protein